MNRTQIQPLEDKMADMESPETIERELDEAMSELDRLIEVGDITSSDSSGFVTSDDLVLDETFYPFEAGTRRDATFIAESEGILIVSTLHEHIYLEGNVIASFYIGDKDDRSYNNPRYKYYRIHDGCVETGIMPNSFREKTTSDNPEIKWTPVLKIGAKVGDTLSEGRDQANRTNGEPMWDVSYQMTLKRFLVDNGRVIAVIEHKTLNNVRNSASTGTLHYEQGVGPIGYSGVTTSLEDGRIISTIEQTWSDTEYYDEMKQLTLDIKERGLILRSCVSICEN
jgi:hypothetical protein